MCIANRQLWGEFLKIYPSLKHNRLHFRSDPGSKNAAPQPQEPVVLPPTNCCQFVALHQGNYATIPNYLVMELRYMDAGE
jgi:hypothetical protein